MIGRLPCSVTVCGVEYGLRTDFRNVLDTFIVFNDPALTKAEKWFTAIYMMFEDFSGYDDLEDALVNGFDMKEACEQLGWFFSAGKTEEKKSATKPMYDWEQDEQMIFSAINHVANMETREVDYMHWWTFLAYFNEIGEGLFSYVVGIRRKKSKGIKLEKSEQQFCKDNPDLVELKKRYTLEEVEFFDEISELL